MDHGQAIPAWSVAATDGFFGGVEDWPCVFWRLGLGGCVRCDSRPLCVSLCCGGYCSVGLGMGLGWKMNPGCVGGLCAGEMESPVVDRGVRDGGS